VQNGWGVGVTFDFDLRDFFGTADAVEICCTEGSQTTPCGGATYKPGTTAQGVVAVDQLAKWPGTYIVSGKMSATVPVLGGFSRVILRSEGLKLGSLFVFPLRPPLTPIDIGRENGRKRRKRVGRLFPDQGYSDLLSPKRLPTSILLRVRRSQTDSSGSGGNARS